MFQERDKDIQRNPGMIAPFGGGILAGENVVDGAKRELLEELNLSADDLKKIGVFESHYRPGEYIQLFLIEGVDPAGLKLSEGRDIVELSFEEALSNGKVTDFTKEVLRSL